MKLSAAILGAGNMGKCHGQNLIKLGVEIAAVCDVKEAARKSFKEELHLESVKEFSCFDTMLKESQFDMLFICLPPFAQRGQFQKAAMAGKHIFIEKPVALSTEEGRRMLESAKSSGVKTQVGFHMRWGAAVKKLKQLVESGEAGRPVLFNGQYECNSLHTPWWRNVALCGGQIFEQAIHLYDICRYLVAHPKSVIGVMANTCHGHIHDYTVEDVSASIASFTNGAVASITANNCAVPGKWMEKFSIVYENVSVFFEGPNKATFVFTKGGEARYETIDEQWDLKYEEIKDFVSAVSTGKRSVSCDFEEGFLSLCYVAAVVNSARQDGVKTLVESL